MVSYIRRQLEICIGNNLKYSYFSEIGFSFYSRIFLLLKEKGHIYSVKLVQSY